jgi:hypothetical protein
MSAIFPAHSLSAFLLAGRDSVCWDSLMKISQKLEYACRALVQLAKHHDGRTLTRLEDLAQREAVSGTFWCRFSTICGAPASLKAAAASPAATCWPRAGSDHAAPDRGRGGSRAAPMFGLPRRRIRPLRAQRLGAGFHQPATGARAESPSKRWPAIRGDRCFTFEFPPIG